MFGISIHKKRQDKQEEEIVGHAPIKDFIMRYDEQQETMNILFNGSPATGKTLFLRQQQQKYKRSVYHDCANSTGRGLIMSIVNHVQKYGNKETIVLLLDEIDKIRVKTELAMLLGLLQDEEVNYVTAKFEYHLQVKLKVFATCNDTSKLSKPLLSRFFILNLADYTLEEFIEISKGLSTKHLNIKSEQAREEVAEEIAHKLFKNDTGDPRQLIIVMKLYNIYAGSKTTDEIIEFRDRYTK